MISLILICLPFDQPDLEKSKLSELLLRINRFFGTVPTTDQTLDAHNESLIEQSARERFAIAYLHFSKQPAFDSSILSDSIKVGESTT